MGAENAFISTARVWDGQKSGGRKCILTVQVVYRMVRKLVAENAFSLCIGSVQEDGQKHGGPKMHFYSTASVQDG